MISREEQQGALDAATSAAGDGFDDFDQRLAEAMEEDEVLLRGSAEAALPNIQEAMPSEAWSEAAAQRQIEDRNIIDPPREDKM